MRLTLISVGRVAESFIQDGCAFYARRISYYAEFHPVVVREERVASQGKEEYILRKEGQRIREKVPRGAFSIVLDERGRLISSTALARSLEKWGRTGGREIVFLLGGPYGLDPELRESGDFCLSLSSMTLTHGMARLLLMEQIYRALTLLRGEPYHK